MNNYRYLALILFFPLSLIAEADLETIRKKAEQGDPEAVYEWAEALYWGRGGKHDLAQAGDFALVGALKKNPLAQYRYAIQQLLGQGVAQDVKAGFEQLHASVPGLQKLAKQNNADALFKLGKLYQLGLINSNHFNPDDRRALESFRAAAAQGHAKAAFLAGQMFRLGLGTDKDVVQARELLKTSAAAGSIEAAFQLWNMHYSAGGEVVSETNALIHLKQAAKAGLREAEYLYGNTVGEGRLGLKPDKKAALPWVRKAANQGHAQAQFLLGLLYAVGGKEAGLKLDSKEAFYWLTLASRAEDAKTAKNASARLVSVKKELEPLEQLDQLTRVGEFKPKLSLTTFNTTLGLENASTAISQSLRLDNLTFVAQGGNPDAMFSLGMFHLDQREPQPALEWLKKAAEKKHAEAIEALGEEYINGSFGEPDFEEGAKWLKQAAHQGSLPAQTRLGSLALAGKLTGTKPAGAIRWFRPAAEKGYAEAQTRLGGLLWEGDVVKQDLKNGMMWMRKAADQRYAFAEASLATMHAQGLLGDEPNFKESSKWARRGAMQGDALAQRTLGFLYLEGKGVLEAKLPKRLDHKRLAYKWLTLAKRGGVQGLDPALNVLSKELQASDINNALAEARQFVPVVLYDPNNTGQTATQADLKTILKNAAAGQAQAQLDLARLCAEGDGVEQSPVEAYKWFTLAFNQGIEEALTERSKLIKAHGMGLDDIIAAKKLVRAFKPNK